MSTRSSIAHDGEAVPAWHLYRELIEPGWPLYLELRFPGGAEILVAVPPALVAALQGIAPLVRFKDEDGEVEP